MEDFEREEEKKPEMTFWGPDGGKMPEQAEMMGKSAPFWFTGLFTDPRAVFKHDLDEGNLTQAIVRVAAVAFILGLIVVFLSGTIASLIPNFNSDALLAGLAIYALIVYPIIAVAGFLIWNGALFIFARILGGSGEFGKQASLFSLIVLLQFVLVLVYSLLFIMLILIPCILFPIGLLASIGMCLYFLYLQTLAISVAHKINVLLAFLVIILPTLLLVVVYVTFVSLILVQKLA